MMQGSTLINLDMLDEYAWRYDATRYVGQAYVSVPARESMIREVRYELRFMETVRMENE